MKTLDQICSGDQIYLSCRGRGGHGAHIQITRTTPKTLVGVETDGSYKPGTVWKVNRMATFALIYFVKVGDKEFKRFKWFKNGNPD